MNKLGLITLTMFFAISVAPLFAQNPQQDSSEGLKLLQTAFAQYQDGRYEEALANCAKALAIDPKDRRAFVLIGWVYAAQDKLKEASESVAKAIKIDPTDKEIYLLKARFDWRRNATDDALKGVRKAIELDPKYAEAHLLLGKLLENNVKQEANAIAAYQTAVSINPQLFQAHEALGEIFEYRKQLKDAEENYRKSVALDPKHMAGRFRLGRMLVEQGRLAEARELWEGRTSDEDNVRPTLIAMLVRAENLKRATEAAAQRPNDPAALVDLGLAVMEGDSWVMDDRQERAIVHFKKALELKPDYARAQYGIVKAYIQRASILTAENKNVDLEMAKLRKLDAKLADEMVEYRKTYQSGLIGKPLNE